MFEQMFSLMDELGDFDEGHVGTDGSVHGLSIGNEEGCIRWEVGGVDNLFENVGATKV